MDIKGIATFLNLTEVEAKMLKERADELGLDPLKGQIFLQKHKTRDDENSPWKVSYDFQIGIEGFRLIAERSEKYLGQDQIMYTVMRNEKEVTTGVVLDSDVPVAATAKIYKKDIERPFISVAHYRDYVQTKKTNKEPTKMWVKWCIMLAKCAEASAFRKGFPDLGFSGLYEPAELSSTTDENADNSQKPPWENQDHKNKTDGAKTKNVETEKGDDPTKSESAKNKGAYSNQTKGEKGTEDKKNADPAKQGSKLAMETQKTAILRLAKAKGQNIDPIALQDITFEEAAKMIKKLNTTKVSGEQEAA